MIKKSVLALSATLALVLPAGAALALDDGSVDDTPVATCDQSQQRLQRGLANAGGECLNGGPAEDGQVMNQYRYRNQLQDGECTGDGPGTGQGGQGNGFGARNGSGPIAKASGDGQGNQHRAGR